MTSSTNPALGAIRLAWWREALERLDSKSPPPEPRLQAAATELLPRGISGKALSELEDGYSTMLEERPDLKRVADRGARLFLLGAKLLGEKDDRLAEAGRLHALARVATAENEVRQLAGHRFPRRLRPITALARLAARDVRQGPRLEPEGTPGRALALLSHRLFGIVA